LYAVGEMMRGHTSNQDVFAKYMVTAQSKIPKPALLVIISTALSSDYDFSVRAAATYCFQCLVIDNTDGQLVLASTLTPPPPDNPNDDSSGRDFLFFLVFLFLKAYFMIFRTTTISWISYCLSYF
jgi:hypothetical protein